MSLDADLHVSWGYVLGQELPAGASRVLELVSPDHAARFSQLVRDVIATGVSQQAEIDLTIRGTTRTYDTRLDPQPESHVTAVFFDITPSKQAELSLRETDRRKDEFLATLSHELRNPLTPLKVALDIARMTDDPAQRAKTQAVMERQVAQITNLVDELLDMSRITQGKVELTRVPLDPATVVAAAVEATRSLFTESRHQVKLDVPRGLATISGDVARLTQVVSNLLTNAVKYTPAGGHIDVAMSVDADRRVVILRIRDDGVGITLDVLPHIFEIFVQCRDTVGRSVGGLRIGLSVVKQLVELHDGKVSAHSDGPKRGSEFCVELPLIPSGR
ncbi:MAG: HAMP domain-containing histidine kinase [Deltaproteobacteria bacterium]|nr:HAMP domain-containing histidine kinase [Deltaproteobacteria bacterium]